MPIATTVYGNRTTHIGTIGEVMGAIKGRPHGIIISHVYDPDTTKHILVVKTDHTPA